MAENIVSCASWNGGGTAPAGYCCVLLCFFVEVCFGLKSLVGLFFSHSNNIADWVGLSNMYHQSLPVQTKILLGNPRNDVFWSVIFLARPLLKFFKPKGWLFNSDYLLKSFQTCIRFFIILHFYMNVVCCSLL